jgi:hypothetical protein
MSIKAFLGWLVVAIVSVAAAVIVVVDRPTSTVDALSREPVFAELRDNPDDVTSLTISSRFDTFTFIRENGEWRAPDKYNYPVDGKDVRELVVKLSDMRFIERKTSNPERFDRLEVDDIDGADSEAVLVRVANAADETLAEAVVGRPSARFIDGSVNGTYIRLPGDNTVWLVSGAVNVQTRLIPWLQRTIVSVPADTVKRVVIGSGNTAYEVVRDGEGDNAGWTIPQVPEGREFDARAASALTRGLASVTLEEVSPASEKPLPDDAAQARFETVDGVAVDVRLAMIDDKPWATVKAQYTGDAADDSDAAKAARANVDDINARTDGWAYWIASETFERLTAPLDKQLIPLEKEKQS